MAKKKAPKARNPIAKVLCTTREVNIRPKSIPNKKGKGSYHSRKGRDGRPDLYSLGDRLTKWGVGSRKPLGHSSPSFHSTASR